MIFKKKFVLLCCVGQWWHTPLNRALEAEAEGDNREGQREESSWLHSLSTGSNSLTVKASPAVMTEHCVFISVGLDGLYVQTQDPKALVFRQTGCLSLLPSATALASEEKSWWDWIQRPQHCHSLGPCPVPLVP